MTKNFTLADGFPDPDLSMWQELAQKALKGAPLDRLTAKTHDGISIKPLYTGADIGGRKSEPAAARDIHLPWDIRQTVLNPDPSTANKIAIADLERGVSSIEFVIDPSGACGIAAVTTQDFATLAAGILTSLATVAINAPADPLGGAHKLSDAIVAALR